MYKNVTPRTVLPQTVRSCRRNEKQLAMDDMWVSRVYPLAMVMSMARLNHLCLMHLNSVPDKKTAIIEIFCTIKGMEPSSRLVVSLLSIQASILLFRPLDPVSQAPAPCETSLLVSVAHQIERVECGILLVGIARRAYAPS